MILKNIRKYCDKQNKSISSVEAEAGLSNGAISKWDESIPSAENLNKVAKVLHVTMDDLMKGCKF